MQKKERNANKKVVATKEPAIAAARVVPGMPRMYWPLAVALLAVIAALVYLPSLHYEFQFDDLANITKHFNIRHYTLRDLFFSGSRWISYWINAIHYSIGKFDPFSYRVFNVGLHCINGLLLFFLLSYALPRIRQKHFISEHGRAIAFITALLFLIHPVQSQTVSYVIQGQLEGMAAFFILFMALCFVIYGYSRNSLVRTVCATFLFIAAPLSCGTKEIAFITPVLLLIIDWFLVAQGEWASLKKRLWLHASLFAIITVIYCYLLKPQFFVEILGLKRLARNNIGNVITHDPSSFITPGAFFISQFKVVLHYLWMFIYPFNISVEYDWMMSRSLFSPDCFLPLIVLIGIGYSVIRLLRKHHAHIAAFGLVWFFACIAPRSSIIPSSELLVDYKTYTASWGWLMLLGAAVVWLCAYIVDHIKVFTSMPAYRATIPAVCALLLVTPLTFVTVRRNRVWRTGLEFWGNILENAPGKARAYNNYGVELSQALQKYKEAIPYFEKAISMDPKYPDPCNNLAVAYAAIDKIDLAIGALEQGLRINPNYPEGYNNLAAMYLRNKQYDKVEAALNIALKLRPYYGKAWFNKGRMYAEMGDQEKSWECFKNCCMKADLDDAFGFSMYARASMTTAKYDDAIFAYKKVLEFAPGDYESAFNLGNAYFFKQQYDDAIRIYQALLEKHPEPRVWYNLGETYYVAGKEDKALDCYNRIANFKQDFPPMLLRMAACYQKLGRLDLAHNALEELVALPKAPDDLKKTGKNLLAHFSTAPKASTAKA